MKILLVDDEESIQILIRKILEPAGYCVQSAYDMIDALQVIDNDRPDLIILDVMMPEMNGFQGCRAIRARGMLMPVIFLSARGDIIDKDEGFDAGGNDYIIKPFDPQELKMRVKAHLRQYQAVASAVAGSTVAVNGLVLDSKKRTTSVDGQHVGLTEKEFQILFLLAAHPDEVFTREQIVEEVWGKEYIHEVQGLPVYIRRIREKIESNPSQPKYLKTVRNVGYKLAKG